jgi:hypothetical protein
MNRTLWVCFTAALVAVGAGCTGGKEFTRPTADSVELGKTTMTQIRDRVGKPRRELNTVKECVQTKTLTYAYSEATPFGETVPARAMSFHFWDGVLVGYDFLSSFDEDKTNFDDARVSEIKKGETTEAQVVALFGPPGGQVHLPYGQGTTQDRLRVPIPSDGPQRMAWRPQTVRQQAAADHVRRRRKGR